jgi:hypothetical protein
LLFLAEWSSPVLGPTVLLQIESIYFIVAWSTAALSHRKPAFSTMFHDSCRAVIKETLFKKKHNVTVFFRWCLLCLCCCFIVFEFPSESIFSMCSLLFFL